MVLAIGKLLEMHMGIVRPDSDPRILRSYMGHSAPGRDPSLLCENDPFRPLLFT